AIEFAGVIEIDGFDERNRQAGNLVALHLKAQAGLDEDNEFGAGVEAFDIGAGIGFGKAQSLSLLERGLEAFAAGFHLGDDEIAGAVENAGDAVKPVAGKALLNGDDGGDAAGDGSAEFEALAFLLGELHELRATFGDESLIGGDDGLAGFERAANPVAD